ncbi:MAG: hypothetical protein KDK39_03560 [Leptospiraceae bacterium]|nr:hypothetical protein [Leptospiraceae bacterium]
MSLLLWLSIAAFITLACVQFLCWGPVLQYLIRRNFGPIFSIDFDGFGFLLPLLYFRARNFRFMLYADEATYDRVYLEMDSIHFLIDPLLLLFGRVRIVRLEMRSPYLEYYNRQDSYKKNRFLPRRHRVEISGASIINGRLYVRDETMTPIYRLELRHINLENMDLDLGTPVDFFFRTERGEASIASGRIEIGQNQRNNEGYIRMWGLTWSELTSIENVPLMGRRLALKALHTGGAEGRHVRGHIGYSSTLAENPLQVEEDSSFTTVNFAFDLNWDEYHVTLDLGLQRLIGNILAFAETNWLNTGFIMGGRGVFNILKKQEQEEQN